MVIYYQVCLYASMTLCGLFLWRWNRHISISFAFTCMLAPIINLGYLRMAVAEELGEAVLANGLVYICGCFLHLGFLIYAFSFCKIKLPKIVGAALFSVSAFIGIMAFTTQMNGLLFKTVHLRQSNGVHYLEYTEGPLHMVYYALITVYFLAELIALIYGSRRNDISIKNLSILLAFYIIDIIAFFVANLFKPVMNPLPGAYVITQLLLLILSSRLGKYAISDTAINTLIGEGKLGFISFDLSEKYLGCSDMALNYLPVLKKLRVDSSLKAADSEFDEIRKWINAVKQKKGTAEFDITRGDISYHITAGYMKTDKKNTGYQIRIEDNTKEREYIRLLETAKSAAENASMAKGDFLASMSHEIRTPINAILGMDEMILRESREEATIRYAQGVHKAGNTLLGLINDVLDFSKIEAGKLDIIPVSYSLTSLLEYLRDVTEPRAKEKFLSFKLEADPGLPDGLHGDEMRIKQCATNILTNAVKYTNEGSVTMKVGYERLKNGILLKISVTDTGIGIKKQDIDRIFGAFERADEERNRSVEGTGLGMSITQRLVALMDGTLTVKSEYGKGSVFTFSVPQGVVKDVPIGKSVISQQAAPAERPVYRESFRAPNANVLVVDDNEINLTVFAGLLKNTQMNIDAATSGDDAISLAHTKKYDLIFLDHRMPGKDGIETLKGIRADKTGKNLKTPCICLTANVVAGAREKYISAGFVEYLTKPVDPKKLEDLVRTMLPKELLLSGGAPQSQKETASQNEELRKQALEAFVKSIDRCADEIEEYYNNGDLKNYTIKVHALKSTSFIVGENELSALAKALEKAGDDGDMDFIAEHTEPLLEKYRSLKEKYSYILPKENSDKPVLSEDDFAALKEKMRAGAQRYDYDVLCDCMDEAAQYTIPDKHKAFISNMGKAVDSVDWGSIKKLLHN